MIRPGKAHRTSMPAEFGLFNADEGGAAAMATMSGYVMALYRQRLRQAHREARGCEPRDDAFLFPEISAAGVVNWRRYANDTDFLELLRSKALESGCPPALCARLQFHGFCSGGASDWFNFGQGRHSIIQFIMRQGRWRSTAFRVYIRLRGSAVAAVMNEVFAAARREHAPDSAEGRRVMGLLTRLRTKTTRGRSSQTGPWNETAGGAPADLKIKKDSNRSPPATSPRLTPGGRRGVTTPARVPKRPAAGPGVTSSRTPSAVFAGYGEMSKCGQLHGAPPVYT